MAIVWIYHNLYNTINKDLRRFSDWPPFLETDTFFLFFFFWHGAFWKSLLNLSQYCFLFYILSFCQEACGILAPGLGSNPHLLHWKANLNQEVLCCHSLCISTTVLIILKSNYLHTCTFSTRLWAPWKQGLHFLCSCAQCLAHGRINKYLLNWAESMPNTPPAPSRM